MKDQLYEFYILHQQKYKENALLVSIFTREFGKLSAIIRVPKKQVNLYQPLVKLRGQISISKKTTGLSKVYNIELVESFYKKSYINLLSLQYLNELLYLLLSYSHEEHKLFEKYNFVIENITDENYRYLLRFFELELLESLGQGIYIYDDSNGNEIQFDKNYSMIGHEFKLTGDESLQSIKGESLLKINQSISLWNDSDLKTISKIVRVNIDSLLMGRELKSRRLLVDYLNLNRVL
ncbi:UNVERIFIED_CONTAM: hypothetical protein GTU68_023347 [Idotea baltica]|nr:hypothetical protein [Idotea baltica]